MDRRGDPSATFLTLRPELLQVAADIVGSQSEAEDVVQDVWLRWRHHREQVTYSRSWLRTVTRNAAIDSVRRRTALRECALSAWDTSTSHVEQGPDRIESAQALVPGMQHVLGTLSPLERTVFVLRQGLDWTYADIARLLGRSEPAVRQLNRRAGAHLAAGVRRFAVPGAAAADVAARFLDVSAGADVSVVLDALAPEVSRVPAGLRRTAEGDVHEVAGLMLTSGNRMWLCHRRAELSWYGNVWDLPGGHLLNGEPAVACVARAAKRKLGISVLRPEQLQTVKGPDFHLSLFHTRHWEGRPRNLAHTQHDRVGFFDRHEAARLRLADPRILDLFEGLAA
jgi:RNA polymerase sigma factor (sigma-70 family)